MTIESTDREPQQALYEGNQTQAEYPDLCVHQLFECQVDRAPEATAVTFLNRRLTYRQVNERANQLAFYLRARGVGTGTLVGVSLERNPEMVVALLAVWKAGAAYVPLDPSYPPDRLEFMVLDADVRVLITDTRFRHLFSSVADKAVCIDADWPVVQQHSDSNPGVDAAQSDIAYVMYTSGSTGKPKGALITHGGLTNYLWWAISAYGVEAGMSVPVHSSISFDLTVTSLYPPLLVGGCVDLVPDDVGAMHIVRALRQQGKRALVKITPAHLELLAQQISADEAAGMTNAFVIGGENLLAESLRFWRESAPNTRLFNEYGPTETVVGCCVHEVQADDPLTGSVPIGRPIANTQLYVLDPDRQPVAPGVTGELYIGGAGVARGYLNRPELTLERFVSDPFSGRPGATLYKTGDLARYRADGLLEYLGRMDDQVKVRGYRIELGEVEAALAADPGVAVCAVTAREDAPGNKQLVAYIVRRGDSLSIEELRRVLRSTLPEYMVPSQFVLLDALPLTPNGKVDRRALPVPLPVVEASDPEAFVGPRTDLERAIAAIFEELLKVDRVGLHSDFFDLGGHSLLAMRAVSRIREVFGVDVPLEAVFASPTVAALASEVDAAVPVSSSAPKNVTRRERKPVRRPGQPIGGGTA